jgi:hypothetical protein
MDVSLTLEMAMYVLKSVAHFFSIKIRFSNNLRVERHFFTFSECSSNVLITGKSNFDEKKRGQLARVAFVKKLLLTELGF